jgi:hypothetical protein
VLLYSFIANERKGREEPGERQKEFTKERVIPKDLVLLINMMRTKRDDAQNIRS